MIECWIVNHSALKEPSWWSPGLGNVPYQSPWNRVYSKQQNSLCWQILSIPLTTGGGTGAKTCGLDDVFPPDDLFPVQKLCVNIYIYMLFYMNCFLWFTNRVLLSDDNSLIPGCLWLLAFVLNNTLILGICCSTIPHLPWCFCPWTFFQNIGFNMVPSDV